MKLAVSLCIIVMFLTACDSNLEYEEGASSTGHTLPSEATVKANKAVLKQRPFNNRDDFDNALKGLIAQEKELVIPHIKEGLVWSSEDYAFIDKDGQNAPESVNPSLWRQAALNNIHGLFKVSEGIYQLRGYDLSNMSIIEGDTGWIIVDPLTARETASAGLLFAQQHLDKKPIKAILFTHSHIDHFGGVQGIIQHLSEDEKKALRVIAPAGFEEEATSENIIAGTAMGRRAMFMYGKQLAKDVRGHVGTGLGKGPAFGTFGIFAPTEVITKPIEKIDIDGVPFVFKTVSGTEAPAEFVFYLPEQKAFCGAELVSNNMHNLYTLRGAKVRDARLWSRYIDESRVEFADAQVYFASHHWPRWGQENIDKFLSEQRDTYKFIHDQSVRMLNQGMSPKEIAEQLKLPESLNQDFHNQGYYGTLKHNAKAVFQAYMGWYDANPANLDPLPNVKAAKRYVEMMGGADDIIEKAEDEFEEADSLTAAEGKDTYRWLAELLNHVVFADPENEEAKALLAKVYDQLGYQAESGPWRDVYLTGAYELRHGTPNEGVNPALLKEVLLETPVTQFFESMAVRLNGEKAEGKQFNVSMTFSDIGKTYLLTVNNSVLHYREVPEGTEADAAITLTQKILVSIAIEEIDFKELVFGGDLGFSGNPLDLIEFFTLLDKPQGKFPLVTP